MVYFVLLAFFLSGGLLYAESGGNVSGNPVPSGATLKPVNPNTVQTLDGNFFDAKGVGKESSANSGARYYGEEPNYNTEQRDAWLAKCAQFKGKDQEAYRKCYEEEKRKSLAGLRENQDAIEKRQMEPLRNVNPLLEDQIRNSVQTDDED